MLGNDNQPILIYIIKFDNHPSKVFAMYFHENINFCSQDTTFSSDLEFADKPPEFKMKPTTSTDNYSSINILPSISKI